MLVIGFDPSFIDTLVRAENEKGELSETLPQAGHHHRSSNVQRVAGGNGVNIAAALTKLGIPVNLVVPSNPVFDSLLEERDLRCAYRIHDQVNDTVALQWAPGEIQFNAVTSTLNREHFTPEVYQLWGKSKIQVSVNWALNPDADLWISSLWLASCGWEYDRITSLSDTELIEAAIGESDLQQPFLLEPGSLKDHRQNANLKRLLSTISSASFEFYPVFSCNEEEKDEFAEMHFPTTIVHTSKLVTEYSSKGKRLFEVPELSNIQTFVGAGDAFIAGLLYKLYMQGRLDPDYAISVAQEHMAGTL